MRIFLFTILLILNIQTNAVADRWYPGFPACLIPDAGIENVQMLPDSSPDNPGVSFTHRVRAAFCIVVSRDVELRGHGECAFGIVPWRFCARITKQGQHGNDSPDKMPKFCVFEDPVDLGDPLPFYSPSHWGEEVRLPGQPYPVKMNHIVMNFGNHVGCVNINMIYPPPFTKNVKPVKSIAMIKAVCDESGNTECANPITTYACPIVKVELADKPSMFTYLSCRKPSDILDRDRFYIDIKSTSKEKICVSRMMDNTEYNVGCVQRPLMEKPVVAECGNRCQSTNRDPKMYVTIGNEVAKIMSAKSPDNKIQYPRNLFPRNSMPNIFESIVVGTKEEERKMPKDPGRCAYVKRTKYVFEKNTWKNIGEGKSDEYFIDGLEISDEKDEYGRHKYIRGGKNLCLMGYIGKNKVLAIPVPAKEGEANSQRLASIWPQDVLMKDYNEGKEIKYDNGSYRKQPTDIYPKPRGMSEGEYQQLLSVMINPKLEAVRGESPFKNELNLCVDIPPAPRPNKGETIYSNWGNTRYKEEISSIIEKKCSYFGVPEYKKP
jgi:hypothetical protein